MLLWSTAIAIGGCQVIGGFDGYSEAPATASASGSGGGTGGEGGEEPSGVACGSTTCDEDQVCFNDMFCLGCGETPMLSSCAGEGGAGTCALGLCSGSGCAAECSPASPCSGTVQVAPMAVPVEQSITCYAGGCDDVVVQCDGPGACQVICADEGACTSLTMNCFDDGPCELDCSERGSCGNQTTIACGSNTCAVIYEPPPEMGSGPPSHPNVEGCDDSCDDTACTLPMMGSMP